MYDEDEFAQLQAQEKRSYEEVNQLRLQQEELKMQMEQVLLTMSAWNIYQRGQAAQKKNARIGIDIPISAGRFTTRK